MKIILFSDNATWSLQRLISKLTFVLHGCVGGRLKLMKEKLGEAEYLLSFLVASVNLSKEQKMMCPEGMIQNDFKLSECTK